MAGRLEGKVAVITGAASGMGRGMAIRFAEEGARVVAGDIAEEGLAETARLVAAAGGQAETVPCDVSRRADNERLVQAGVQRFGKVDIAIANAGIGGAGGNCFTMTEEQWDRVLDVNARGVFFTFQAAANQMIAQGSAGRLVATASMLAAWGTPGAPAYCASKGAVIQLVRVFAQAGGPHGITANAIGPGFTETAMSAPQAEEFDQLLLDRTPVGRVGQPADMAAVATFLASDESSFVSGAIIPVDGGITAGLYAQWLAPRG